MAEVRLENVWKKYGDVEAVKNLNIDCRDKEFLCILGPSGCGKSSTLRMIAGLESITAGKIYIDGIAVNNLEPFERDIAMVFENYALYPHKTVFENMAYPLKVQKLPNEQIRKKVNYAAEILDIGTVLERYPRQLSGGQKQRVAIGRAIVRNPKVFLLDEPISHLDAKLRTHMRGELKRLHKDLDATMIYVTHDQEEAFSIADRILILHEAKIFQTGSPREIYAHPESLWVASFFGFTNQLNGKVLSLNPFIINTEIGRVAVLCGLDGFSTGDALDVVIPPAAIKINARKDGKNIFIGKIIESNFHGMNYRIKIKMQNSIIFTFESNSELLVGEPLKFSIDPGAVLCFLRNP